MQYTPNLSCRFLCLDSLSETAKRGLQATIGLVLPVCRASSYLSGFTPREGLHAMQVAPADQLLDSILG